jgi:hypothetical protein
MSLRPLLIPLLVASCVWSQAPATPDTPAGHTLQAWLEAFNSGDRARIEACIAKYNLQAPLEGTMSLRNQTGGFELLGIDKSESRHIEFRLREKNRPSTSIGRLDLKDGDPAQIATLSIRALPGKHLEVVTEPLRTLPTGAGEFADHAGKPPPPLTNLPPLSNLQGQIAAQANLRAIPPSSALARNFIASYRPRELNSGRAFYSRILINRAAHAYLGYELILEPQQQAGAYLLTFGKLGITPLDVAATYAPRLPENPPAQPFTMLPIPPLPEPQLVHEGQAIAIDLFTDPSTGDKLFDDLHIVLLRPMHVPGVPTASGDARDFLATDADFEIFEPQVTLNGKSQTASGPASLHDVRSALPWFYFPNHGRFILSLTPRTNLGFRKTGEVRGGRIAFTLDDDSVKLESIRPLASGNGVYNLYVLHEPDWQPVSDRQKDYPVDGSLDVEEIPNPARK